MHEQAFLRIVIQGRLLRDTRELLNWKYIAETITDNLKEIEMKSIVTLNWYDSGQLSVALNHEYNVGVIGPNNNHFKYINLNSENFYTCSSSFVK